VPWTREGTAVVLVALLASSQLGGFKAGPLDLLDALTFAVFGFWLARRLTDPAAGIATPSVLFFGGALLVVSLPNLVHQSPVTFVISTIVIAKVMLLTFLLVQLLDGEARVRFTVQALVAVALVSGIIGILQVLVYYATGRPYTLFVEWSPGEAFKYTPVGFLLRASALNPNAQMLATILMLSLPFLLFRATAPGLERRERLFLLAAVGVAGLALLLTWNYVAFAGAALVLLGFPFLRWPHLTVHLLVGILLTGSILYYLGVADWLYSVSAGDPSIAKGMSQRITLLKLGLAKLGRDPWFGEGRDFVRYSGNYWHRPVHNAYVQAATELGIVGGLIFSAMLVTLFTQLAFLARRACRYSVEILRPALLAFAGLMVNMLGEPMFDAANTWLTLGLVQAMILVSPEAFARAPPRS
jgi:hypothetical protein